MPRVSQYQSAMKENKSKIKPAHEPVGIVGYLCYKEMQRQQRCAGEYCYVARVQGGFVCWVRHKEPMRTATVWSREGVVNEWMSTKKGEEERGWRKSCRREEVLLEVRYRKMELTKDSLH